MVKISKMIYLRVIKNRHNKEDFDLFDGDIEKDRKYWKKYHNSIARYFKLKEVNGV